MKTRFFYGVFTGFFLGCLFFFGVVGVKGQTTWGNKDTGSTLSVYSSYYTGAGTGQNGIRYLYIGGGQQSRGTTDGGTYYQVTGGVNGGAGTHTVYYGGGHYGLSEESIHRGSGGQGDTYGTTL